MHGQGLSHRPNGLVMASLMFKCNMTPDHFQTDATESINAELVAKGSDSGMKYSSEAVTEGLC
jgi:hypothetical protein